jgi:predicted small lipoprotein YifL
MKPVLTLALLLCTVLLASCGKKGPPDPPGPPSEITYPRSYPTH